MTRRTVTIGIAGVLALGFVMGKVGAQTPAKPAMPAPKPAETAVTAPVVSYRLGAISALAVSADGKRVAMGTYGQVVVFDTTTWQPTATFRQVADSVRSLAFHPDNQRLAIGSGLPAQSGQIVVWDVVADKVTQTYPLQKDTIEAIAFAPDGKGLLFGANDNKACYYNTLGLLGRSLLDEHNGRVEAVAVSPKSDFVFVTGALDRIVKVWDRKRPHTVVNFDQSEAGITGLAFLPNGVQFVGSSMDGRLYWWGVDYNEKRQTWGGYHFRTIGAHDHGVYGLAISQSGNHLITCGADSRVKVWNTDGGFVREFKDSPQPIYVVALSPDGKTAFGGGREGLLYVWNVETGKPVAIVAPPALPAASPTSSVAKTAKLNQ